MTKVLQQKDLVAEIGRLHDRIGKLERRSPGATGTMTWIDPATGNEITIGALSDGTFGIQIGTSVKIIAATGDITAHGLNTGGQMIAIGVSGTALFITNVG